MARTIARRSFKLGTDETRTVSLRAVEVVEGEQFALVVKRAAMGEAWTRCYSLDELRTKWSAQQAKLAARGFAPYFTQRAA